MKIIHPKTRNEALSALFQVFFDIHLLECESRDIDVVSTFFKKATQEIFKNDDMILDMEIEFEYQHEILENRLFMLLESCICRLFNGNSLTGISRNQIHDMISISKHIRKDSFWVNYNIKWKLDLNDICLGYEE